MGHIFISYSHNDSDYAHKLAENLQKIGFEAWIDERLDYGSQWPQELQKQLDSCSAFIVIMSPRSYESDWVQSELQRARRKSKPIFPMLLEGDEPWLSVESTQYYDVRGEVLPDPEFYSDLRTDMARDPIAPIPTPPAGVARVKPAPDSSKRNKGIGIAAIGLLLITFVGGAALLIGPLLKKGINPTAPVVQSTISSEEVTSVPEVTLTPEITLRPQITDIEDHEMAPVPAGEFMMGRRANDEFAGCQELNQECQLSAFMDEEPVHKVYLDAFNIDIYEVTNALYKACEDQGVCDAPQALNSNSQSNYYGNPDFDQYPVIYVTWNQAKTYCETWRGARLPSEAEWEKAARGIDGRPYPWGEELNESFTNFNYSIGDTTAVGTYENGRSPYGAYDMAGNVWEWVADWYDENYYQGSPTENPPGPASGDIRVLRGGSWGLVGVSVSTSYRYAASPSDSNMDLGFRCARDTAP